MTTFVHVGHPVLHRFAGGRGVILKAVLCHYERSDNCLDKETVVKMGSTTLYQAMGLNWVEVGL